MTRAHDDRSAFRCAVAPEDSAAKVKISGALLDCAVVNTSRDGFCIRINNKLLSRLNKARKLELWFRGEKWEVEVASQYCDSAHETNVGLSRIRELTKIKSPSSWGLALIPQFSANTDPTFLFALVVAFLLTCLCLPGIGDHLGTAPKVRKSLDTIVEKVSNTIN